MVGDMNNENRQIIIIKLKNKKKNNWINEYKQNSVVGYSVIFWVILSVFKTDDIKYCKMG